MPSSGYINTPINVSWSPLPGFSFADFSFVKVGYRLNGGNYSFKDYRGSSTSLTLEQTGNWCFIIRGWNSNEDKFGSFNVDSEQCVQIKDLPTPSTPTIRPIDNYLPVNKQFTLRWDSNDQYASYYRLNGANLSNTSKSFSFSNYGSKSFSVQACNSQNRCSSAATTGVYIYASPGFVRNLTSNKNNVDLGENVNITWDPAGGMIPSGYYTVSLNGQQLYSGKNTNYTHHSSSSGTYTYKIGACNPNLPCTDSIYSITVKEGTPITGKAYFNFEPGSANKIIDPYYNKNEYLSWNVSQVKNVSQFQVVVSALDNRLLGTYKPELIGENVRFKFGDNINNDKFRTNQEVKIKLKACNSANQCSDITDSSSTPEIKLVKWNNIPYYEGTPLHIVAINTETDTDNSVIYNKLWPRATVGSSRIPPANGPHYFYEVDAMEFMSTYMFPYSIDDSQGNPNADKGITSLPDKTKVLFDGIALWDNGAKYGGNYAITNRFENTFNENANLITPLKAVGERHFWRENLDNIFGVKSNLQLVRENGSSFSTKYLFKPDIEGKRISIFDALHEVTKDTNTPRGVYLMLPTPFFGTLKLKDDSTVEYKYDNNLFIKRTKYYIDEVIEQYSLFLDNINAKGETTNVRLAGFKWGQESASMKNESDCLANKSSESCLSVFNELLGEIKSYLNSFTVNNPGTEGKLQHVAFAYSKITADFQTHASPGKKFSEISCEKNNHKVEECIYLYSTIRASGFVDHFDQIFFQPNATIARFSNKKSGDMSNEANDREILDWYVRGLFNHLRGEINSKYSLMIEYTGTLGKPIITNELDFDEPVYDPGHAINPLFKNFRYPAYRSRLEGDNKYPSGFYGDLSYYTDYIMTQFPSEFREGKRSFLYDDNGGVVYCYTRYALGIEDACSKGKYGEGKLYKWELVESISELRSLYSFIELTRDAKKHNGTTNKTFRGDNNIFPDEPIITLNSAPEATGVARDKTIENIAINAGQSTSVKSLVRARLLEDIAFYPTITGDKETDLVHCSAKPRIRVSFFNNDNIMLDEQSVELTQEQFKYACLTYAMKSAYFNGGRGEQRGMFPKGHKFAGKRQYGSGYWPDVDNWELLEGRFTAPSGTVKMSITLEALSTGLANNLEAYLFYRPEYTIH